MTEPKILVAGIGNVFLGDDGFGVQVVRRLLGKPLPESVRVVDFGIRGIDLSFALLDAYEVVILIDTVQRGGPPGTLHLLKLDANQATPSLNAHATTPANALALAKVMGAKLENVFLLGCEPESFSCKADGEAQLSEPVAASVNSAAAWAESIISRCLVSSDLLCLRPPEPEKGRCAAPK